MTKFEAQAWLLVSGALITLIWFSANLMCNAFSEERELLCDHVVVAGLWP